MVAIQDCDNGLRMKWICFVFLVGMSSFTSTQWTYQYKKMFSPTECAANKAKQELQFVKQDTAPFCQMILSWNGTRPRGHFTFSSQVRDAKTKKWHSWHKMSQWGTNVQRSFFSEDATTNHHVRLEIPQHKPADALRIKVTADDGALLSDLHALFVCVSDFTKFEPEHSSSLATLASVEINNIPQFSQMELDHPKKEVLCSPTSCSMVTSYLMDKFIDPVLFANNCYDTGLCAYGSWPYNVAHAYECCDETIHFAVTRLNSFKELHKQLMQKIPVIVSVRGHLAGAPQEYKQGHLLVVIGWDAAQQKVICHDPAFVSKEQTRVAYAAKSFLQAWERSRRLAYLAQIVH